MLCIKNCLSSSVCTINDHTVEHIFVHIPSLKFIVGVVYIPPSSDISNYVKHSTVVKSLADNFFDHHILIVGNYNILGVIWPVSSPLSCVYTTNVGKEEIKNSDYLRDSFSYCNCL